MSCLLIRLKSNLDKTQQSNHLTIGGIKAIEINHATMQGIQQLQLLFTQLIYAENDKKRHAIDQQRPHIEKDAVTEKRNALFRAYDSSNSTTTITSQTNSTCSTATEIDKSLLDIVNEVIVESNQGKRNPTTMNPLHERITITFHALYIDQNGSIIFIALYRKFMKPLDLVTVLIQRYILVTLHPHN